MSVERMGIPHLEKIVSPVPAHATLLFVNDPGVEAEPFLYQAAHQHLSDGGEVVYAVTNRSPGSVLTAMQAFGLDVFEHRGRLRFIDAFSALMGAPTPAEHVVADPNDPQQFAAMLEKVAQERPGAWLIVDSLSTLVDQANETKFAAAFPRLFAAMQRFAFSESLFTRWPYGNDIGPLLDRFDGVVNVKGVEDRVMTGQYFVVERAAWKPTLETRPRLFKALKPGGVHVYIPKILVTGPYNAGKSSFLHAVSDVAVSADHLGTTVAMDHGRVTMDGLTADLFGTPGQARFDPILKILAGQALGVIVVVDSTQPDSFARAKDMLTQTWKQGLPGIIAANKQDAPGALSPDEVARLLQPPPRVRVVGCTGQDRESARKVLQDLMEQILLSTPPEVPA
ncbi:MAG TPA: GTP-binding protein [Candidatus Thermoplasmatota archaeon]|nr:GTP-binding protein [Candidatus Thermoplasmatota archaeon]